MLFDPPSDEVMRKWHLLTHDGRAHVVVMPHVTAEHIDQLCADMG
ncbi:hypothetical protein AB0H12_39095 [Actinosynnema sp. NPDC023794]